MEVAISQAMSVYEVQWKMKYKFFCIPARTPEEAADEMNNFIASKQVAEIDRQLIANGDRSYWSVCVSYIESGKTWVVSHE